MGNSERMARLSGVNLERTIVGVYILSGVCSALVGVMLDGFAGQGSLGMGDPYLLPTVAVVASPAPALGTFAWPQPPTT